MVRCSTWQLLPLLVLQVTEIEGLLAKLDKTKKHLDNAEFVQAMGKKKQVGRRARQGAPG